MATGASSLNYLLPSGNGIFRIIPVEPSQYSTAYVSTNPGSYKQSGFSGNWYGSELSVAEAEKNPTGKCIYEVSRLLQDTPVANMYALPQNLQEAIYADRELLAGQFDKSHIVLSGLSMYLPNSSYSGIYFPTRRGDGGCILINRAIVPIRTCYTGERPPTAADLSFF